MFHNLPIQPEGRSPSGEWTGRVVIRPQRGHRVRPIAYDRPTDDDIPHAPQAEIDACLACPLPDCDQRRCPRTHKRTRAAGQRPK